MVHKQSVIIQIAVDRLHLKNFSTDSIKGNNREFSIVGQLKHKGERGNKMDVGKDGIFFEVRRTTMSRESQQQ